MSDLREAAVELLKSAQRYYEVFQKERETAAVIWLEDEDGQVLIFTRGEYREQLMQNIRKLPTVVHRFDEED